MERERKKITLVQSDNITSWCNAATHTQQQKSEKKKLALQNISTQATSPRIGKPRTAFTRVFR